MSNTYFLNWLFVLGLCEQRWMITQPLAGNVHYKSTWAKLSKSHDVQGVVLKLLGVMCEMSLSQLSKGDSCNTELNAG